MIFVLENIEYELLPPGQHVDNAGKYSRRFDQLSCGTLYNSFVKRRKLDKQGAAVPGGAQ